MRKKGLIITIISLLAVLLLVVGTIAYLILNTSPKKIFLSAVDSIFAKIESEEQYNTTSSTITLGAELDSENNEISAINDMIKDFTITLKSETDIENKILNNNVIVNNKDDVLIDANTLVQDNSVYIYYKELIDKYLEIPMGEDFNLDELIGQTIDVSTVSKELKNEIKLELEKQNFASEKKSLTFNEKQINVKKSTIQLDEKGLYTVYSDLLKNLKNNQNFMNAFGDNKEAIESNISEAIESFEEEIEDLEDSNKNIEISIYTKGLLNDFVKFEIAVANTEEDNDTKSGISFTKPSEGKYELLAYQDSETLLKLDVVDNKTSKTNGIMTITLSIPFSSEKTELVANLQYENKGNSTTFILTSELQDFSIKAEGTINKQGKGISGDVKFSLSNEELTVILKCNYQIENGISVAKQDLSNSVKIDELTSEEMEEISTNFEASKLYEFLNNNGIIALFSNLGDLNGLGLTEPQNATYVKKAGYNVKYNVADGFEASGISDEELRMYFKDTNSVSVFIEETPAETYLKNLSNDSIMKSTLYTDQKIRQIAEHQVENNKFSYVAISYKEEDTKLMKIVYCYALDAEKTYVVEFEAEQGVMTMSEIDTFLNISVSKY